jgi:non-heme Fe2+,alpha-ketoglutarate-dependent halogenase
MGKLLSDRAVEEFRRDGYHFPVDAFSEHEAVAYRAQLESFERQLGSPLNGKYRSKPHLLFTFLNGLVRHPRILDAVEDVLGPNLLCWNCNFFTKEAGSKDYVSWHQDATYWGLSSPDVVTAWVALTPSNADNGAMCVIPGSQHEQLAHSDTFGEHNLLSRGQEIQVDVDQSKSVMLSLEPGQFSLHHVLIVHGSGPNISADRRIGLAIRYIPTYVKQTAGPKDSATLVRGVDSYGHFELEPQPARDLDPDMVRLHAELADRSARILYRGTDVMEDRGGPGRRI